MKAHRERGGDTAVGRQQRSDHFPRPAPGICRAGIRAKDQAPADPPVLFNRGDAFGNGDPTELDELPAPRRSTSGLTSKHEWSKFLCVGAPSSTISMVSAGPEICILARLTVTFSMAATTDTTFRER